MEPKKNIPNGKAAAALIAGGTGIALIGVFSTLAEVSAVFKTILTFNRSVGTLAGISIISLVLWGLFWWILGFIWKDLNLNFGKVMICLRLLLIVGLTGTFPLFYKLFAGM